MEYLQEIKKEFIKTGDNDLDLLLGEGILKESLISIISGNNCKQKSIQFSEKLASLISDKVIKTNINFEENIMQNTFKMIDFYKLFKDTIKSKDKESVSTIILNINNIECLKYNNKSYHNLQTMLSSVKRHCLNNNVYIICVCNVEIFKSDKVSIDISSSIIYLFDLIFKVKKYDDLTLIKIIKHLDNLHLNLFYQLK